MNAVTGFVRRIMRLQTTQRMLSVMTLLAMLSTANAQGVCNDMQFVDVTASAGINHLYTWPPTASPSTPGGATAADVNGDGWLDLYAVQGDEGPNLLYINDQNGGFTEEAAARGAQLNGLYGSAASAADFDNDGDIDLGVSVYYGNSRVLINDGSGNFTSEIVLPLPFDERTFGSAWGDVDNDGYLELAIGMWIGRNAPHNTQGLHVYKNTAGALQDYEFRTVPRIDSHIFAPRFADLNGDRLSDLHVVADYDETRVYMNIGGGMFVANWGFGGLNDMGHAIGDYDKDGDLDIFTTDIETNDGNTLWKNDGLANFTNVSAAAGIADGGWAWAGTFGDLDLDADLDIYHVNGFSGDGGMWQDNPSLLFMNNDDGTFTDVAACANAGVAIGSMGRGMHMWDYDNDGDLDIFIVNNRYLPLNQGAEGGHPVLLRNDTPRNGRHYLKVTLDGTPPMHRDGIGSRVYVQTGSTTQMHEMHASTNYLSQDAGHIAHFGLDTASVADTVTAEWVTGDATVVSSVNGDQQISIPSPTATVSSRTPAIGQQVTATSNESDPVEWEIGGSIFADPATTSFSTGGTKELKLLVYNTSMTQVVRTELIRINVNGAGGEPDITLPVNGTELPSGDVTFSWNDNGANVDGWQLLAGTSVGDNSLYDSGVLAASTTAVIVSGLPEDGSAVHVTLRWTDGSNTSEKYYTYTAATGGGSGNSPPTVVRPTGNQAFDEGDSVSLDAAAAFDDPDGDPLTYSASGLPASLSIDSASGLVTGTLTNADVVAGPDYAVVVTATEVGTADSFTADDGFTITVAMDTTAPVITRIGAASVTLTVGDSYADEGATAMDNIDGDITANIVVDNPVDTGSAGTYTVRYNVSDAAGNAATEVTRTVTVNNINHAPTVVAPTGNQAFDEGDSVSLDAAAAFDDPDGDPLTYSASGLPASLSIDSASGLVTGTLTNADVVAGPDYAVVVTATEVGTADSFTADDGFTMTITGAMDTTAPVITRIGAASVTLTVGDSYADEGATAMDNNDGDITANIVVDNPVDTGSAGTYTVRYNVSDAAGNAATEVTRTVTVNAPPVVAPPPTPVATGGGGGSISLPVLLLLTGLFVWRRRKILFMSALFTKVATRRL